jgi:integrase
VPVSVHDETPFWISRKLREHIIAEYKASSDFRELSAASQRDYRLHMDQIAIGFSKFSMAVMTRRVVLEYRDSLADKPATANYRMAVLRRLFSFAVDRGYAQVNNAAKPKKFKTGTHAAWTMEQLEKFQGTKEIGMLSGFYLALFTGQRQADIVKCSWASVKDGKIEVRQQKTGKFLLIPMHAQLKDFLDRLKLLQSKRLEKLMDAEGERAKRRNEPQRAVNASVAIVSRDDGLPYKRDHFSHAFKDAMDALGIAGVVFHGLRKNAARFLLQAGCTEHEVSSITGMSPQMVRHYAKGIEQESLAEKAMEKLEKSFKL